MTEQENEIVANDVPEQENEIIVNDVPEQENEIVVNDIPTEGSALLEGLRRVLMAGIGVAVLAQEEIEDFVTRLVDRGEIAENDGRSLVSDVLEQRRKEIQDRSKQASDGVDRRIEGILNRLNVPTQSEIASLSGQISELSKKVDELRELDELEEPDELEELDE